MQYRRIFSIFALVSSALLGCSSNSVTSYPIDEYDEIPGLLEAQNVPGVSIAFINDFKIDRLLAYGVKNRETMAPVTADTLFQAASMSKSVAAVAAMVKSQNGMIELDEDINNYLTSWAVEESQHTAVEKVNLRRLLSHRAGTTVHGFAGYSESAVMPTLVEILNGQAPANSPAVVVANTPGKQFRYSGGGYTVAQQALIDITQQPFENLMDETVLTPLAMTSSTFDQALSMERLALASAGHDYQGRNIFGDYNRYPEMSAAGLWTTPEDMAKLLIELQLSLLNQSNVLLTAEAVEEMLTPIGGSVFNTVDEFYGLGFSIWKDGDEYAFGHGGANNGFISHMVADAKSGDGIVVMTNGDNGQAVIDEVMSLHKRLESSSASQQ